MKNLGKLGLDTNTHFSSLYMKDFKDKTHVVTRKIVIKSLNKICIIEFLIL